MELKWKQNCDTDHLMWNIRTQQRGYQRHLDVRTCSTDAVMRELRLTNGQQSLKATVHLKAFKLVLDLLRKVSSAVKTCRWAPSWLLSIILEAHSHTMQLKGCTNGSTGKSYRSSELNCFCVFSQLLTLWGQTPPTEEDIFWNEVMFPDTQTKPLRKTETCELISSKWCQILLGVLLSRWETFISSRHDFALNHVWGTLSHFIKNTQA